MNLEFDAAKVSAKKMARAQHQAEIEAIYAGRPFRRLPREELHNFIRDMVDLLSA
jgi:hypothetical protein